MYEGNKGEITRKEPECKGLDDGVVLPFADEAEVKHQLNLVPYHVMFHLH